MAGESGGVLGKVLFKLSQILEDDQLVRRNIQSAMRYPIMVVAALGVALFVLSVFVIPQFSKIYAAAKVQLPLPTLIMIWLGKAIKITGLLPARVFLFLSFFFWGISILSRAGYGGIN